MSVAEGPLVLADISGYTEFLAHTQLGDSRVYVTTLLRAVSRSFAGRLEMAQLEGDAVFFVGPETTPQLIDWVEDSYTAFHRRLRRLVTRGCDCEACKLGPALTMKVIAHHGRYSRQRVGGVTQVHGLDIVVPHRLAKNSVPSHEYLLATQPILDRLTEEQRARFIPHQELVGEFGQLQLGYRDLGPLRERLTGRN